MRHVIGIDLGGTKLSGGIFSGDGRQLHNEKVFLERKGGSEASKMMCSFISGFLKKGQQMDIDIEAIGICVPGIVNRKEETIWAPNIPGWDNYPLMKDLRTEVGAGMPIVIENDRSCYILGEKWKGTARNCSDAIFIAVGTGIGAGIMANNQILEGSGGIAGAIGWMCNYHPFAGNEFVNFENYASGTGIELLTKKILELNPKVESSLREIDPDTIKSQEVFGAYEEKDPIAILVFEQAIHLWGTTVANLVSIFNPEKIIFGGGVFGPAVQFLDRIKEVARKYAQPISIEQVSLEKTSLNGDAGLIGAAYSAVQKVD